MKIYIASSWRNAHGVEMLTAALRNNGHKVISWVENNFGENHNHVTKKMDPEAWMNSVESDQSFQFDTLGATKCEVFIWYGPGGMDAAAELGASWADAQHHPLGFKRRIYGLWAKGEQIGLMRKMVDEWFPRVQDLINHIGKSIENHTDAHPRIY